MPPWFETLKKVPEFVQNSVDGTATRKCLSPSTL
jgi:hypothetical protein